MELQGITSFLYLQQQRLLLAFLQVREHAVHKNGTCVHLTKVEHMLPVRHNYHNAQHAFLQLSYVKYTSSITLVFIISQITKKKEQEIPRSAVLCKTYSEDYKSNELLSLNGFSRA